MSGKIDRLATTAEADLPASHGLHALVSIIAADDLVLLLAALFLWKPSSHERRLAQEGNPHPLRRVPQHMQHDRGTQRAAAPQAQCVTGSTASSKGGREGGMEGT